MSNDAINNWVERARQSAGSSSDDTAPETGGVQVIRRAPPSSKGAVIMEIAEKLWPSFMKLFEGVHDENNIVLQPAHVRGIALNVAQELIKKQDAA